MYNILKAVAIGPDVHQSPYSSGTSTVHADLPEYPIKYNTLLATGRLTNLLKL